MSRRIATSPKLRLVHRNFSIILLVLILMGREKSLESKVSNTTASPWLGTFDWVQVYY